MQSSPVVQQASGGKRFDLFNGKPSQFPNALTLIERCGKINAVNPGSESWTGIGVVAGCAAIVLIT
jgi:hypothetical protein